MLPSLPPAASTFPSGLKHTVETRPRLLESDHLASLLHDSTCQTCTPSFPADANNLLSGLKLTQSTELLDVVSFHVLRHFRVVAFHSWTLPSTAPEARMRADALPSSDGSSGLNLTDCTITPGAKTNLAVPTSFFTFHTLIVPSEAPDASHSLSELKLTLNTHPSCPSRTAQQALLVGEAACHILTVLSIEPEASHRPSGLKVNSNTRSRCPSKVSSH